MFGDPCYGVEKYLEVMYTCHKKKALATRLDSGGRLAWVESMENIQLLQLDLKSKKLYIKK